MTSCCTLRVRASRRVLIIMPQGGVRPQRLAHGRCVTVARLALRSAVTSVVPRSCLPCNGGLSRSCRAAIRRARCWSHHSAARQWSYCRAHVARRVEVSAGAGAAPLAGSGQRLQKHGKRWLLHRGRMRTYQLYADVCYYRDALRVWCVLTDEFPWSVPP